ncbi:MAG: sugar ABC transporter ATP-binding protein, partial [Limnochordales bacterium]
ALAPDEGRVYLDGAPVTIASPWHAQSLGISTVYQELSLIPSLSVAENIFLGRLPRRRGIVDWDAVGARAREVLRELDLEELDPWWPVHRLRMAEQQLVEIARVLTWNPKILLLDEPTSALSDHEVQRLFAIIERLRGRGVGIIYVSHRLAEVRRIAHRVTVLRDGRRIATVPMAEVSEAELVRMMVGRDVGDRFAAGAARAGEPLLEIDGLATPTGLDGVRLTVGRGEVLGLFGLIGSGRTELARALFGLDPVTRGSVRVEGRPVDIRSPEDAIRAGLAFVTEDRRQGLVYPLTAGENVTLASLRRFSAWGLLRRRREAREAEAFVKRLRVHPPDPRRQVRFFSGGNQQKVVLAKWLCTGARVLILDEPTRGIDVGAKAEVYEIVRQLAAEGAGILLISSEPREVLAVCDRVAVMYRGRIVVDLPVEEATEESLMSVASGLEVPA